MYYTNFFSWALDDSAIDVVETGLKILLLDDIYYLYSPIFLIELGDFYTDFFIGLFDSEPFFNTGSIYYKSGL
jgi:hypothetical protein